MATYSVNWSATLVSALGPIAAGYCAVSVSGRHTVATTANRATYGRTVGIAAQSADVGVSFQLIVTGLVPSELTGLASGAASWVRVSETGRLERCTPTTGDDIVGKSLPDGSVQFHPGVWDSTNVTSVAAGGGADGKTVKAMADANQTLTVDEAGKSIFQTTGALTAPRTLLVPDPASAATSYYRLVHNACTAESITVGTATGTRTIRIPPGCTSLVDFSEVGATENAGKVYDPRDFGCPWDDVHDDLPGWQAMMSVINALPDSSPVEILLPRGRGYFSDTIEIAHPVRLEGRGATIYDALGALQNGMRFACLRTGIVIANYFAASIYPVGNGADGTHIDNLALTSTQAVVADPTGGNGRALKCLDTSLDIRQPSTFYEVGSVVIKAGSSGSGAQTDYTNEGATRGGVLVMFRATVGGTTSSGSAPTGFASAGIAQLGSTIADDGVTWTVESIPKDYVNNHAYAVGQRVLVPGDPGCYFECIVAGTSIVAASPTYASNGIGLQVPTGMLAPPYGSVFLDDAANPGGLKWKAHFPVGVMNLAGSTRIETIAIAGFTGNGIYYGCNLDGSVFPSTAANSNICQLSHWIIAMCGSGLRYSGSDTNGCTDFGGDTYYLGSGRTNVDAAAYLNKASPTFGTGAASILDRGQGTNKHFACYGQFYTGAPYRNDNLGGGGNESLWVGCEAETAEKCLFIGVPKVECCNPIAATGDGIIAGIRGMREVDNTGATPATARLGGAGHGLYGMSVAADAPNEWGWVYETGYWKKRYGSQNANDAYSLSSFAAGLNPGLGWLIFDRGHLDGTLFRGPIAMLTSNRLREGQRKAGDTFTSGSQTTTTLTDGYRGVPWAHANHNNAYVPWCIPASVVEPTANVEGAAGQKVFKMLSPGAGDPTMSDVSEPNWATATIVGDTVTEAGSGIVWSLIGFTPDTSVTDAAFNSVTRTILTSNATPVFATLATLAVGDVRAIDVTVKIAKADGSVRQVFKLSGLYYGAAGPTATIDGTVSGTTGSGTGTAAATLDVTGAIVRLKITGIAATDLVTTHKASVV